MNRFATGATNCGCKITPYFPYFQTFAAFCATNGAIFKLHRGCGKRVAASSLHYGWHVVPIYHPVQNGFYSISFIIHYRQRQFTIRLIFHPYHRHKYGIANVFVTIHTDIIVYHGIGDIILAVCNTPRFVRRKTLG